MSEQIKFEAKVGGEPCPRCDSTFTCNPDSIGLCQCQTISLSAGQLEYVRSQYNDFLCVSCLFELQDEFKLGKNKTDTSYACVIICCKL